MTNWDLVRKVLQGNFNKDKDLEGANLELTDFYGKDLSGVNLHGIDLRGVNLEGAVVTKDQLARARCLIDAIMPDGSRYILPSGHVIPNIGGLKDRDLEPNPFMGSKDWKW